MERKIYEELLNNSILNMLAERSLFGQRKQIEKFVFELSLVEPAIYSTQELNAKTKGIDIIDHFIDDPIARKELMSNTDKRSLKTLISVYKRIQDLKVEMAELAKNMLEELPKIHYTIKYEKQIGSSKVKAKDILDWYEFTRLFLAEAKFAKINNLLKHEGENRLVVKDELHQAISKIVFNIDSGLEKNIYHKLFLSAPTIQLDIDPEVMTFKNGKLNITTMEFTPGEFKTINLIPWNYNPEAKSPYGREIMDRYVGFNEDFDKQIFEAMGLMMMQDRGEKFKCAIFANGKSDYGKNFIFDHMILPAIGKENIGLFKLSDINDPTETTSFVHKTAAYDSDADNTNLGSAAKAEFKRITGGNMVKAKILYKDLFTFENYATMWINCNGLPKINDAGSGGAVEKRLHVIQFTVPVKTKYYDPNIFARVKDAQQEISEWLIAEATIAIHKALKRGSLTKNDLTNQALESEYFEGDAFHRWASHYFGNIYDNTPIKADLLFKTFLSTFEEGHDQCSGINVGYKKDQLGRNWFVKNLRDNADKYQYIWRDTYKQPNGTQTRSWVLPSGSPDDYSTMGAEKTFDKIFGEVNDGE